MHDKYFLIPILDDIRRSIKQSPKHQVLLQIGEFVNLSPKKIQESLRVLMSDAFEAYPDVTFKFEILQGKIKCLECGYEGKPGTIFADPHAHTDVVVECPSCHSTQTKKLEGGRIIPSPVF